VWSLAINEMLSGFNGGMDIADYNSLLKEIRFIQNIKGKN